MPTNHTPGRWYYGQMPGNSRIHIYGEIYNIAVTNGDYDREEANARLIAAAPDMLAALRAMLEAHACDGHPDTPRQKFAAFRLGCAAIAKAEGQP